MEFLTKIQEQEVILADARSETPVVRLDPKAETGFVQISGDLIEIMAEDFWAGGGRGWTGEEEVPLMIVIWEGARDYTNSWRPKTEKTTRRVTVQHPIGDYQGAVLKGLKAAGVVIER